MKVLGNLELVGGSLVGAVLEILGQAPTKAGVGRDGQLFVTADGLGFIDASGDNQTVATAGQVSALTDEVNGKLSLADGGIVAGAVTFSSVATFSAGASRASLPTVANDLVNKSYVDELVGNGVVWSNPVDSFVGALPAIGDSVDGQRVILNTDKKIYTYELDDETWTPEAMPTDGVSVFVDGTNAGWRFDGTDWVRFTGTGNQTAGDGLTITGSVINLVGGHSLNVTADAVDVKVGAGLVIDAAKGVIVDPAFTATLLGLSGGTLTGALTLAGAPTADLHAATKLYVDEAIDAANDQNLKKFSFTALTAETTHVVAHNLATVDVTVTVRNAANEIVIPDSVTLDSANQLTVTVGVAQIVKVVVVG